MSERKTITIYINNVKLYLYMCYIGTWLIINKQKIMLKIHKFNKRLKTTNKNAREDNQKVNQSSITNNSLMNSSSLSRITKTEEDLLFKTDRKMPDEKDIYDIENKLDSNNYNTLEVNDFERENYMSNRDVSIPKKIAPTNDSVVNIQKEITNRKRERENEKKKEKEAKEKKDKENKDKENKDSVTTSDVNKRKESTFCQELIIFLLVMIIILSAIAMVLFFVFKST